jgi:general secretion pathway protein A
MYKNIYGLPVVEPKYFYSAEKHATGLSYLHHGITSKKGIIVLTGEHGVGKTLLVKNFVQHIATNAHVASFSTLGLSFVNFYKLLCQKFDIDIDIGNNYDVNYELLMKLKNFAEECDKNDQYCIVIIDEAQNLSYSFSQQLIALSNFETDQASLIQIVLVGGLDLQEKLDLPEFANLKQRIGVSYTLPPLDAGETEGYINARLGAAGMVQSPFTRDAIDALYQYSKGIPRVIDSLCDLALFIGLRGVEQEIESPVITQAARMLYIQGPETSQETETHTGRQGVQAFDDDHAETIDVRSDQIQEKGTPDLPLLANFPKLLEDMDDLRQQEGGIGRRLLRRLIKVSLVAGVIVGCILGIGAWQRHKTETAINDQSPPFSSSEEKNEGKNVEGLESEQFQPIATSVPLHTAPSTPDVATLPTASVDIPEPLPIYKIVIAQKGDTLWKVIQREYPEPHPRLIALVQAANPEITNPAQISVGQRIVLPIESQ